MENDECTLLEVGEGTQRWKKGTVKKNKIACATAEPNISLVFDSKKLISFRDLTYQWLLFAIGKDFSSKNKKSEILMNKILSKKEMS